MPIDVIRLLDALDEALGDVARPVPLHEPLFGEAEAQAVARAVTDGWVSSAAPDVAAFERKLCEITGAAHAVATVNGTAALHLALLGAGVRPGDEVLMPPLTFVATANAAVHAGAVPHFVDVEAQRCGLDPAALAERLQAVAERRDGRPLNRETGRRIAAVCLVHVFGIPACDEEVRAVCREWNLPLVEDAAEALGSRRHGRHVGRIGRTAALSFNGNKIVTTGGGGAILADDPTLAARLRHLATTARCAHPWRQRHDRTAFNYRMPGLNAALGAAQLERLADLIAAKEKLGERYRAALDGLPGVDLLAAPSDSRPNHWLHVLRLDVEDLEERDALLAAMHERGLMARPVWDLLHRLPMYEDAPRGPLPTAERLEPRLVCLPSGAGIVRERRCDQAGSMGSSAS